MMGWAGHITSTGKLEQLHRSIRVRCTPYDGRIRAEICWTVQNIILCSCMILIKYIRLG
jgi:hypothetical protein